jgi:hypothetical protein
VPARQPAQLESHPQRRTDGALDVAELLARMLVQRLVVRQHVVDLRHVHKAVAVAARHVLVDLCDRIRRWQAEVRVRTCAMTVLALCRAATVSTTDVPSEQYCRQDQSH